MDQEEEFKYERISEQNLVHLISLYRLCFSVNTDLTFLKKKYDTQAFGSAFVGYLAFSLETNEVAAYYGVFPMKAVYKGKHYLCAQSGDTMTNPKFQGKGLFTKLAKMTYELGKKEGLHFVFGFPNQNSYPGFVKKLSWQHQDDMNHYVIRASAFPGDKIAKKFSFFHRFYRSFVSRRLKKYSGGNVFENSTHFVEQERGFISHEELFFEYKKYYDSYLLKCNGIECIVKVDGRLWVGDLNVKTREQALQIIEDLIKIAKRIACSSVQFTAFNNTFLDFILQDKYLISSKIPVGYLNLSGEVDAKDFVFQALDFDTF